MTNYLLAGGGTAGHVNPLLALADEIKRVDQSSQVFALGTEEGLEAKLVPNRGYPLLIVPKLPMPRKINSYLFSFPKLFRLSVEKVKGYIRENEIDVVVGFGGYASAPAYRAAKELGIPLVIHEANAKPGYANKVGAKWAKAVAVTFSNTNLPDATLTGMPMLPEMVQAAKTDNRAIALKHFGLSPNLTTLLVTGGSLGAKRINDTIAAVRELLRQNEIQVIHIVGERAELSELHEDGYIRLPYCDRMDLAMAAADFAVSRAGASTVSELAVIGLPSVLIPYAVGNGEQESNARDLVQSGGAILVLDKDFDSDFVQNELLPILKDKNRVTSMSAAAKKLGITDGSARLLQLINATLKS